MKKKIRHPGFDETIGLLRMQGFEIAAANGVEGGMLVSKYGAAAVLAPSAERAEFAVRPGALVGGEVARLVDRGYQKFVKTSQYELPASAQQLQAIHAFSEELKALAHGTSLYNESLGTTSDSYLYDRVQGRAAVQPCGTQSWKLAGGH